MPTPRHPNQQEAKMTTTDDAEEYSGAVNEIIIKTGELCGPNPQLAFAALTTAARYAEFAFVNYMVDSLNKERKKAEQSIIDALNKSKAALQAIDEHVHGKEYDWNADPQGMTLKFGDAYAAIEKALDSTP